MKKLLLLNFFALIFFLPIQAQTWTYGTLDINQVKTVMNSNGDLFWNYSVNTFEVPADSGKQTIFAGASWIGGIDTFNTLHIAAQTYRQSGNDFYPGPVMSTSSYSPTTDAQWNQVWKINKTTIDSFVLNSQNPIPGYTVPSVIVNWPGNGDTQAGQAAQLAPYIDVDADGVYNPSAGDYPCIKGDQALFVIYNDDRNTHTESGGAKFTFEVHAMMYAYNAPGTWLDSTVFINYKLFNRSPFNYNSVYWGQWTDFDLGFYGDDFVGCDVDRNIAYVYNGNQNDGSSATPGVGTYGANPPAQGLVYLRGPEATPMDGIDNDRDGITDESDEVWMMNHFIYYNNNFTITGNPVLPMDYYNYLSGNWLDTTHITYGGNGYGGATPCEYMYPADSDPTGWGTNFVPQSAWDEMNSNNTPGDRRGMASSGPFYFGSGKQMCIDMAYVYGRGNAGPLSSVGSMRNAADSARTFYSQNNPCSCDASTVGIEEQNAQTISVYPNPAGESLNIICGENATGSIVEIINLNGQVVLQGAVLSGNSVIFNTGNLASGVYLIRVQKESVVLTTRFVKE